MVTHVAVCGDSFGVGAGLPDETCYEDNFSGVFAKHFDLPQRVYARSGCCNFTIYLQVKKIIEQVRNDPTYKPFVLITSTFHERLIFPLDDGTQYKKPDLSQVEYMSYNPYYVTNEHARPMEFEVDSNPRLITETLSNITYYQSGRAPGIARLFEKVSKDKFDAIGAYYGELFDTGVKHMYDEALYTSIHYELTKLNIPHLVMGYFSELFDDNKNFMRNNWGMYTQRYPDPRGSGHCDEEGNRLVGLAAINHVEKYNLL